MRNASRSLKAVKRRLCAAGGVIAYRAAFLAPHAAVVLTDTSVHEVPHVGQVAGGLLLLFAGALVAFFAARRRA
ncbi:MAG TPA: hypothetical protein VE775_01210 [Pyrinomonadaceae bacterium]|nr:hypothetical protein [Pyrinomonadaceae bacterium]